MKRILNNNSKELIKSRILNNAAKLWGLQNPYALDPFVTLLIDAFSTEIFKLNNELDETRGRILEKLARMLTPSIHTSAQPAHAIGQIGTEESTETLLHHQEFYFKKNLTSTLKSDSDLQITIPFTPIDNINLIKANVSMIIGGRTCFINDEFNNKFPLCRINKNLKYNTVYLGIDFSKYTKEQSPSYLSFYCANQTFESIEFVYNLLPYVNVFCGDTQLNVKKGLTYPEKKYENGYDELFYGYSIKNKIEEDIKNIYETHFIEFSGFKGLIDSNVQYSITEELKGILSQKEIQQNISEKKILWLKLEFPPQYTIEILEDFNFHINAFPIYNRGWKKNESSLDIMGSNIPLITQVAENFLYVDVVSDSHGRDYQEILFTQNNQIIKGLYTIRKGGMERFSERNAIDMIKYVLELTRDEVSAFSILERDKVVEALTNMIQQMGSLDQKANTVDKTIFEYLNYVIVEPFENTEFLTASYWVTHCEFANNIRKGTELIQQEKKQDNNKNKKLNLLTYTQGGKSEQKGTNAIQAYKYALTTRDKIVSNEDIKNFCKLSLKEQCVDVIVFKGTIVSDKPKEGFIRTVNVEITINNYEQYHSSYWNTYAKNLKRQIIARAIDGIEYLVTFKSNVEE